MSAVADVLNGAADLIERDGWVQGCDRLKDGVCVGKAIDLSAERLGEDVDTRPAYIALERSVGIGREDGRSFGGYVSWNDVPGRTKDEVVAALRTAAERAS